jgi:hypothetical protein
LTEEVKAEPAANEAVKEDRDVELSSVASEPIIADHEELSQVVGDDQQEQSEEPEQLEEDATLAPSLGSDALVTEQKSLLVAFAPVDVADPIKDVPGVESEAPEA